MAITYPISLPTVVGFSAQAITPVSVVGVNRSPFTGQRQVYAWPGQWWDFSVSFPKMTVTNAGKIAAALTSLNGQEGTFLLGPSLHKRPVLGVKTAQVTLIDPTTLNGGFETAGGGGADVFASWTETPGSNAAVTRDTSDFHGGAASCKLASTGGGGLTRFCQLSQTLLTVGRSYFVSFWAKTSSAGNALCEVRVMGGSVVLATLYATGALTGSWTYYSGTFTAQNTSFYLQLSTQTGQTTSIDDVSLVGLEENPKVHGGSQTGYDLITRGWVVSDTVMTAGDWVQLGTGSGSKLHRVMVDAISDGSGHATLTLWPRLRSSPADGDAVNFINPQGVFALTNASAEAYNSRQICDGIDFQAMEVVA